MDAQANEYAGFHSFLDDSREPYGSFEVFWTDDRPQEEDDASTGGAGWYWWACFPGCLPDGEPMGPFASSALAYSDAQGY